VQDRKARASEFFTKLPARTPRIASDPPPGRRARRVNARFALCDRKPPADFRREKFSRRVIRFTDAVAEKGI